MNQKCIGECIEPDQKSLHPLTLEIDHNTMVNKVCSSNLNYYSLNNISNTIICDKNNDISFNEINNMLLVPENKANIKSFLELYNITSFNATILWLKINMLEKNYLTINRILDSSWKIYHDQIKKVNQDLIDIYDQLLDNIIDEKILQDLRKSKNRKKIIKKSLKKFIEKNDNWDSFELDSNKKIGSLILKYFKKYN